jgi:hypothetical protein
MKEKLRFLGLDVHAETIAVAIAEPDGEVQSLERFRTAWNRYASVTLHSIPGITIVFSIIFRDLTAFSLH